jgi:hypothetical protein
MDIIGMSKIFERIKTTDGYIIGHHPRNVELIDKIRTFVTTHPKVVMYGIPALALVAGFALSVAMTPHGVLAWYLRAIQ